MVLTLGILDHVYSSVRPQIMRNPIVSSLPETLLSEDCRSCGVIWHYYNNLRLICTRSSGEATAEEAVLKWKDEGSTLVDVLMAAVLLGADEEVLEEDEVALSSIITTTKTQTIRSISASFWRESQRECTYLCYSSKWRAVVMSVWAVSNVPAATEHTDSIFLFLFHSSLNMYFISCFTSSMSHIWIIDSGVLITWLGTEVLCLLLLLHPIKLRSLSRWLPLPI